MPPSVSLYLAWIVSLIATAGSLYYSEVRHFLPCSLCWYQRILMYPLALQLAIATFTNDRRISRYALPLSGLGIITSSYHYLLQRNPSWAGITPCASGIPCNTPYINYLGFITIPLMALTAFTLITLLLAYHHHTTRERSAR